MRKIASFPHVMSSHCIADCAIHNETRERESCFFWAFQNGNQNRALTGAIRNDRLVGTVYMHIL